MPLNRRLFLRIVLAMPIGIDTAPETHAVLTTYPSWIRLWGETKTNMGIYLDAQLGDDANDGLSPDRAVRTIDRAREIGVAFFDLEEFCGH